MVKDKYPMQEFTGPRRVLATPMNRKSAVRKGLSVATKSDKNEEGFWVKEPIGKDHAVEYWIPNELFNDNHVMTKQYTIGDIPLLLNRGMQVRRPFWPANVWIELRPEKQVEDYNQGDKTVLESFVARMQVHKDPLDQDKSEFSISHWQPTQDDIFAKDFQAIKLNFNPVHDEEENTK